MRGGDTATGHASGCRSPKRVGAARGASQRMRSPTDLRDITMWRRQRPRPLAFSFVACEYGPRSYCYRFTSVNERFRPPGRLVQRKYGTKQQSLLHPHVPEDRSFRPE